MGYIQVIHIKSGFMSYKAPGAARPRESLYDILNPSFSVFNLHTLIELLHSISGDQNNKEVGRHIGVLLNNAFNILLTWYYSNMVGVSSDENVL